MSCGFLGTDGRGPLGGQRGTDMRRTIVNALALLLLATSLQGCGLLLAGTAGGVAGSELAEDDGNFDPLERTMVGDELESAGDAVGEAVDEAGDAID